MEDKTAVRVKVYLPGFINHDRVNPDGTVELPPGSTLATLYRLLSLPLPLRVHFFFNVNYEPARWNTELKNGDTVTFLLPMPGG